MHSGSPRALCFSGYALDLQRCALMRGGEELQLRPKSLDVLQYLAERPGRLVSKEELIKAVWADVLVTDDSLVHCVKDIREALSDDAHQIIKTVPRRGYLFAAEVSEKHLDEQAPSIGSVPPQEVIFCKTADGVNLAVATAGSGLPLVNSGRWLTHIEYDWRSPVWMPLLACLAAHFRLIRYDPRGCGLSDWEVADISFEAWVRDLETVVDALGLQRFALLGISQGAAVSIAYAAHHPERVSRLVLSGGFALGWRKRGSAAEIATREAMLTLMQHGWGQDNPAFRQVFSTCLFPGATPEQVQWLDDFCRVTASPENAVRVQRAVGEFDVVALLPHVAAPTLVLHSLHDAANPFENGLMLARSIPNARFVELDSRNHLPLSHEPAWPRYMDEVCRFLKETDENRLRLIASSGRKVAPR